jgi:CRISPR-associated endoribonuclease Cas6
VRLRLTLDIKAGNRIEPNFNYQLSSAVYKLLQFGSPEFSSFLHSIGYRHGPKHYKLFTFALKFNRSKFNEGFIEFIDRSAMLYISSPLIEDFIKNFLIGTFEQQYIELRIKGERVLFNIKYAELIPAPEFSDTMNFVTLSPIILSTTRIFKNEISQYYLRPEDTKETNRILTQNLKNKHAIVSGKELNGAAVELEWNQAYLAEKKRVTKKITIEKEDVKTDVVGIQAPFSVVGHPELIKTGYECGFGEKTSMGFGMAEAIL